MTLSPDLLLHGYSIGIFPMAEHRDDTDVFWVDPKLRGVMPLNGFHLSRSLARRMRRGGYQVTINQDFEGVVDGCADRSETWISASRRASTSAITCFFNSLSSLMLAPQPPCSFFCSSWTCRASVT